MANPNPHQARKQKSRNRIQRLAKAGTLADTRLKVWRAICAAEEVMYAHQADAGTVLKCVHALQQAASTYAKVVEATEIQARLAAVEAALQARDPGRDLKRAA
ncbi:MAG TPA: hypothetical protein VGW38_04605 [Chloroflexota bacterium]|nr:hypothetical protein [Chloroflexota bacterium]